MATRARARGRLPLGLDEGASRGRLLLLDGVLDGAAREASTVSRPVDERICICARGEHH